MKLSRIRSDAQIVGYLRHDLQHVFFSKDQLWWNGAIPPYTHEDHGTGMKDSQGRLLFVQDIVRISFQSRWATDRLACIRVSEGLFFLEAWKGTKRWALDDARIAKLTFESYVFLNVDAAFDAMPQ